MKWRVSSKIILLTRDRLRMLSLKMQGSVYQRILKENTSDFVNNIWQSRFNRLDSRYLLQSPDILLGRRFRNLWSLTIWWGSFLLCPAVPLVQAWDRWDKLGHDKPSIRKLRRFSCSRISQRLKIRMSYERTYQSSRDPLFGGNHPIRSLCKSALVLFSRASRCGVGETSQQTSRHTGQVRRGEITQREKTTRKPAW